MSRHKTTSFPGPQRGSRDANDPGTERKLRLAFLSFIHHAVCVTQRSLVSASFSDGHEFSTVTVLHTFSFFLILLFHTLIGIKLECLQTTGNKLHRLTFATSTSNRFQRQVWLLGSRYIFVKILKVRRSSQQEV